MPNVPNVPGVPALLSYSPFSVVLLVQDVARAVLGPFVTRWGIFLNGVPVLAADNQISFEYLQDFPISDYPVEKGGFQSYNKVQLPGDIRVSFSAGGSEENRQAFLASVDAVMNTISLYDVVTPEKIFLGYNFTHRNFRRTAQRGVGLIVVELRLTEVRPVVTTTFTSTQQPGIAGRQGAGAVEPQPVVGSLENVVVA